MAPAEHPRHARPVRTCIGCRRRAAASALVRITRAGGVVVADGASSGRGAWLCRDANAPGAVAPGCLAAALAGGRFERAWRGPISADERSAIERLAGAAPARDERRDAP